MRSWVWSLSPSLYLPYKFTKLEKSWVGWCYYFPNYKWNHLVNLFCNRINYIHFPLFATCEKVLYVLSNAWRQSPRPIVTSLIWNFIRQLPQGIRRASLMLQAKMNKHWDIERQAFRQRGRGPKQRSGRLHQL